MFSGGSFPGQSNQGFPNPVYSIGSGNGSNIPQGSSSMAHTRIGRIFPMNKPILPPFSSLFKDPQEHENTIPENQRVQPPPAFNQPVQVRVPMVPIYQPMMMNPFSQGFPNMMSYPNPRFTGFSDSNPKLYYPQMMTMNYSSNRSRKPLPPKTFSHDIEKEEDIEHDELGDEMDDILIESAFFSFELRPCRRLDTKFSKVFPTKLSKKPYKYIMRITTDSPTPANLKFYLTSSPLIKKFALTIQKPKFSPTVLNYTKIPNIQGVDVRYYRRMKKSGKDADDNMVISYQHYYEIQFIYLASSKSKTFFRLNITSKSESLDMLENGLSQRQTEENVVFTSTPFLLYVRKSSNENKFWEKYSCMEIRTNGITENHEKVGEKRGRMAILSNPVAAGFSQGGMMGIPDNFGRKKKKRKIRNTESNIRFGGNFDF